MDELDKVCKDLYDKKIWLKVWVFKNAQLKRKKNKDAILHALRACLIKGQFQHGPWAYAEKIMQIENGNYNEREYREAVKKEFPKEKREVIVNSNPFEERIAELRRQADVLRGV